jgi:hypothetical protein
VGPSAGLDHLGKREGSWSAGSRIPDRPAPGLSHLPADAWQLADVHEQIQLSWPSVPCSRLRRPLFPLQAHAPRGQAGAAFIATSVVPLTRSAPCHFSSSLFALTDEERRMTSSFDVVTLGTKGGVASAFK